MLLNSIVPNKAAELLAMFLNSETSSYLTYKAAEFFRLYCCFQVHLRLQQAVKGETMNKGLLDILIFISNERVIICGF